jgi:hypothetical protein
VRELRSAQQAAAAAAHARQSQVAEITERLERQVSGLSFPEVLRTFGVSVTAGTEEPMSEEPGERTLSISHHLHTYLCVQFTHTGILTYGVCLRFTCLMRM